MDDTVIIKEHKPVIFLGRDITKIPCYKNSMLYGISGGVGVMLGTFLLTSRTRFSSDVGVGAFVVITMSYWCVCRYRLEQNRLNKEDLTDMVRKAAVMEGTPEGPPPIIDKNLRDI